eukprot:8251676-Prorocentrum_lima.AAC.1
MAWLGRASRSKKLRQQPTPCADARCAVATARKSGAVCKNARCLYAELVGMLEIVRNGRSLQ